MRPPPRYTLAGLFTLIAAGALAGVRLAAAGLAI